MKLYIRTEANSIIATGHLMRCLAIADAAKKNGIDTVFITAEDAFLSLIHQRGHESICLFHKWDDFDSEIPMMQKLIAKEGIQVLLIDSYYVSMKYMEAMRQVTYTAYIDDLHAAVWPCSMLINYAIYSDLFPYQQEYPTTTKLLGCTYAPLRKEYAENSSFQVREKVQNVLVVTGGTDEFHFILRLCEAIAEKVEWKGIHFKMICGRFNQDLMKLKGMAEKCPNLEICTALPSLLDSMKSAELILTAGGTTLYEMAAVGIPGICFSIADNQFYNVNGFAKHQLAVYCGDLRKDFSYSNLIKEMEQLMDDVKRRSEMSNRLKELVDGHGAERIVNALCSKESKEEV